MARDTTISEMVRVKVAIMGVEIVRGILYIRDSTTFTPSALKKLLILGMQINGQNIRKVSSKSWDVQNIKRLYLQHLNLKAT